MDIFLCASLRDEDSFTPVAEMLPIAAPVREKDMLKLPGMKPGAERVQCIVEKINNDYTTAGILIQRVIVFRPAKP